MTSNFTVQNRNVSTQYCNSNISEWFTKNAINKIIDLLFSNNNIKRIAIINK